jgi:hypothetical protein
MPSLIIILVRCMTSLKFCIATRYLKQVFHPFQHGGKPSTWDSHYTLELGCIAQGLSEMDLLQLPLNDSLVIESFGSYGGWTHGQVRRRLVNSLEHNVLVT